MICSVAPTPDSSGSCRSITTTSGRTALAIRTAAAPSAAVPTTANPASSRSRATASRHIGWSSTTITRTWPPSPGDMELHLRTVAGHAVDQGLATEVTQAPHDRLGDAEPPLGLRRGEPVERDAGAIIAHGHHHLRRR